MNINIMQNKAKSRCVILALILFLGLALQQNASAAWPVQFGGIGDEEIIDMAVDKSGNIIVVGMFAGKNIFPVGQSGLPKELVSMGGKDIFIVSYNSGGDINWVRNIGGTGNDIVTAVVIDHENSIYLSGNIGTGDAIFGLDREITASSANRGFKAKFYASGNKVWAKPVSDYGTRDNDTDLALYTTVTTNAQQQQEFNSGLMASYTDSVRSWKGYINTIQTNGVSDLKKFLDDKGYHRQEAARIAASSATEAYVLGSIGGIYDTSVIDDRAKFCGTIIESGGPAYPWYRWQFISKYEKTAEGWTCSWLKKVDEIDYRGDIVTDNSGDVYYSAAGLIKRLNRTNGDVSILGKVSDRSLILKPTDYSDYNMVHVSTDRGGLAVDDEQNVYISGVYVGAPIFAGLAEAAQLRTVNTPTLFVAKLSANERSAAGVEWKWATSTSVGDGDIANIAQKNARIDLSSSGNTVFVAGSTSGYERFNDSVIRATLAEVGGALSFDGIDNSLKFDVPHNIANKQLVDYQLSFKVKIPEDAKFPLTLLNSPLGDGNAYQLLMPDASTLEVHETVTNNFVSGTTTVITLSFSLGLALNNDVWHKLNLTRTRPKTYDTMFAPPANFSLSVNGTALSSQSVNLVEKSLLFPVTHEFGGGFSDANNFKGLIDDLKIKLTSYTKGVNERDGTKCYFYGSFCDSTPTFFNPTVTESQWTFNPSTTVDEIIQDTLASNNIQLADFDAAQRPLLVSIPDDNFALRFDGVDNVLSIPIPHATNTQIPTYEISVKFWLTSDAVYPQVLMSDSDRFHVIMKSPTVLSRIENSQAPVELQLAKPLEKGKWHTLKLARLVEVHSVNDYSLRLPVWLDGIQIFEQDQAESHLYHGQQNEINAFLRQALSFGQTTSTFTFAGYTQLNPFKGFVDDISIIAQIYALEPLELVDPNVSPGVIKNNKTVIEGGWEFNTPLTDTVIPNIAPSGSLMDIVLTGMTSAQLPSQLLNLTAEPRDGYISLLDAVSGAWLIPQSWEIGQAIALPVGASDLRPDIKIDGQLATDSSSYLYWSPSEGKLYAIGEAPGIVTIEWKTSSDTQDETRVTTIGSPVQTSELVQTHIAGTSVALEPAHAIDNTDKRLVFSRVVYPANSNNLVTSDSQGKMFNRSVVTASQSPYVVLQFTVTPENEVSNPQLQGSVFQVVYTKNWLELAEQKSCLIGQAITDDRHDKLSGRNGHVVNSLSRYDNTIYNAGTGPIFAVNQRATDAVEDYLGVVWFTANSLGQFWADTPVKYNCTWPQNPDKNIVIANQQGYELPSNMSNPSIYRQANPNIAGYNPNEEHALIQDNTVFALRNDLNSLIKNRSPALASEPYVLVKYQDSYNSKKWAFEVLAIEASTIDEPFGPKEGNQRYRQVAGSLLQLPQPLTRMGVCEQNQITFDPSTAAWEDYKGFTWARAQGNVTLQYYYPLQEDFDFDLNTDGIPDAPAGSCIPWLDRVADKPESTPIGSPININYSFVWPESVPLLKPGETVFSSKEVPCSNGSNAFKACYLPTINGQAAAQIIFDQTIQAGLSEPIDALAKLIDPISARSVHLAELNGAIATFSQQGKKYFSNLPFVLRSRLSYDEINKTLSFKGTFDDSQIGDPHLLPNIMTAREQQRILDLDGANDAFKNAVVALYSLTRNPNSLDLDLYAEPDDLPDSDYLIGLQPKYLGLGIDEDGDGKADNFEDKNNNKKDDRLDNGSFSLPAGQFLASALDFTVAETQALLGTPMALSAGRPSGEGYLTVAFNNHPSLSSLPVSLQVIKLDSSQGVYQGSIWIVPSDNVFEESLTLRHTGDFAGDPDNINFQWYYQPDTNGQPAAPDDTPTSPWLIHQDSGPGALDVTIEGPGLLTLSDNWFITRYGGKGQYSGLAVGDNDNTPSPWAGDPSQPANAPKAMLATGWIKRVIAGLNPFDQRVQNFHTDTISTLTSMIAQAGEPFTGPIPFNPDPDVINGVGIIEAYQTVLDRGQDLSIRAGFNDIAANTQLLNAASRIADLYMLLGNEAYADAQDPTIGFDTKSAIGTLASSIFTFQNQLVSPLEEELVLLRGRDDSRAGVAGHPVNNRLFWNFTQGNGEVAYAQSYRITDQNADGFINETDARILYPQGHGDAWGHYLTSVKTRYSLLQEPNYTWVPRAESVLVAGVPIEVDYLDERKFAAAAAAKARAGAEIVNLTYREKYVEAPAGQWQGYKDTDRDRAWGLDGWGRRSGQGAYFDWLTANAILPATDPNPEHTGIEKIDRTTVIELDQIVAGFNDIQAQLDKADAGLNPLGLAKGVVPFDIDPSFLQVSSAVQGQNHFDQIASRAQKALDNAIRVFDHASQQTQSLRKVQDDVDQLSGLVKGQERDFKHQLIEIFGYPYAGDIGGGKTYPSDYDGPDYYHYMYVNSDLTGDLPQPDGSFTGFYSAMQFGSESGFIFDSDSLSKAYKNVNASEVLEVDFPNAQGADWQYVAPSAWGKRRAPGRLQVAVSDLLQSQAQLQRSLTQHENLLITIEAAADLVKAEFNTTEETITVLQNKKNASDDLKSAIGLARAGQLSGRTLAKVGEEIGESVKECFPKSVGFSVDATSSLRCTALAGLGVAANVIGFAVADSSEIAELKLELSKESAELQADINLVAKTTNVALLQRIKELEQLWREEAVLRIELFTQSEVVNQNQGNYFTILAEGQRLLEERRAFRIAAAADTQRSRYTDLTFRIFRNDALAKYRAQFDLAARYVYLAAAAYDYETNLLGNESGAGREFLADIVRQRSLGQVIDGKPIAGTPGLADVLARLTQNFDVYRGQLGFNNPQVEENRFSLRKELFRQAGNDEAWRKTLEDARVENLWDVPEFRRYARPFTVESAGAQPGLVIRFSTTVTFGLNFFGHELGGGDSAYDPTNFATKVRAVGTWFKGYDGAALSNTPRVYLVPVGMDVLRSPSGDDFKTREWRVVDQKLPAPFPIGASDLTNPDWIPINDSLSDTYGDIRRMSSFRAYHDSGAYLPSQSISDSRLVGRSVWNTEWMLIIPGGTLRYDPDEGLDRFIHGQLNLDGATRNGQGITDILLHFQTYGFSGN
ncbi:hypothetical protein [Paraglaciecola sp. 25GB23A]|uniref:hypothetical protein n=1 Tax=Paraglaciecola sp. 25GB23A TaxID=3156068 RepID=UPI0032AFFE63